MLVFSHDEVVHGKGSMLTKMAGANDYDKFANLRAAYGFMFTHPGKKLLFMGQDFAQRDEWYEKVSLNWDESKNESNAKLQALVKELNKLYTSEPALFEKDQEYEGFGWVNCVSPSNSTVSFYRQGEDEKDMVFVVCNFDTVPFEEFKVGVPKYGKYKEVLNTDDVKFGGSGLTNKRVKVAKKEKYDGREYSMTISLPALSVTVFKYEYAEETPSADKAKATKTTASKKTAAKPKKSKIATQLEKEIAKADMKREKEETAAIKKVASKDDKAKKKTAEKKVEEKKPTEAKAAEKKVEEKKPTEAKAAEKKVEEKKPTEAKIVEKKAAEKKIVVEKDTEKENVIKQTTAKKTTSVSKK